MCRRIPWASHVPVRGSNAALVREVNETAKIPCTRIVEEAELLCLEIDKYVNFIT